MVIIKSADKADKGYIYIDKAGESSYINIVYENNNNGFDEQPMKMNQETAKQLIQELMYHFNIKLHG